MASSQLPIIGFEGSGSGGGGDESTAGTGEADARGTASGLSGCPCGREPVRGLKGSWRLRDGEDSSSTD